MFVVFYIVNLYICVFMTYSTSCCFYDTYGPMGHVCVCVCDLCELYNNILSFKNSLI